MAPKPKALVGGGGDIIGLFWQTILSKGMRTERFLPNLMKICQKLQTEERRRYLQCICYIYVFYLF